MEGEVFSFIKAYVNSCLLKADPENEGQRDTIMETVFGGKEERRCPSKALGSKRNEC